VSNCAASVTARSEVEQIDRSPYATPPGPIAAATINGIFRRIGLQPSGPRHDRILDEARATLDPLHLMRVFGISATTAMKTVHAPHPERRSTLPHY
jgi:hypothetical protein